MQLKISKKYIIFIALNLEKIEAFFGYYAHYTVYTDNVQ